MWKREKSMVLSGINVRLRLGFGHVIERFTRRTNLNDCLEVCKFNENDKINNYIPSMI